MPEIKGLKVEIRKKPLFRLYWIIALAAAALRITTPEKAAKWAVRKGVDVPFVNYTVERDNASR